MDTARRDAEVRLLRGDTLLLDGYDKHTLEIKKAESVNVISAAELTAGE
jgi:hypothetical protein